MDILPLPQGRREAKQKAAQLELERQEQRRIVGKLAYQRWLKNKQDEDELLKKEKVLEKEVKKLKMAEKEEEKYRAQETFRSWKRQKALEMKLQRQLEGEETRACSPTPRGILMMNPNIKSQNSFISSIASMMKTCSEIIFEFSQFFQSSQTVPLPLTVVTLSDKSLASYP